MASWARLGLLLSIIFICIPRARSAELPRVDGCETSLTAVERAALVTQLLDEATAKAPVLERLVLQLRRSALENRALRACAENHSCGQADLAAAVEQSVNQTLSKLRFLPKLSRADAIQLVTWGSGIGLYYYASQLPSLKEYATQIAFLAFLGMRWLGQPLLDKLAPAQSSLYKIFGPRVHLVIDPEAVDNMRLIYRISGGVADSPAQIGGQRLNQFLDTLDKKLSDARALARSGDERGAALAVAQLLRRMRTVFFEIQPENALAWSEVLGVVHTSFPEELPSRARILESALEEALKVDEKVEKASPGAERRRYYLTLLQGW